MNLHQKLIEVRKVNPYLQKENSGNQYKYVSSSQVLASVVTKLNELNVLLIPSINGHKITESVIEQYEDGKNSGNPTKRTTTYFTELDMNMTWVNADNPEEKIESSWYGQGVDIAGEKGVGKALTYAEKYFMLKFFNIATDKDDPDTFQQKNGDAQDKPGKDQKPNSAGQNKPESHPQTTGNGSSIPLCSDCKKPIAETIDQSGKVKGWCDSHKERFKNKVLCQKCQQNYK